MLDPDRHERAYEGTYLSALVDGLAAFPEWDDQVARDDDCVSGHRLLVEAARQLVRALAIRGGDLLTLAEIVELGSDHSTPWGRYVDPALSVVLHSDNMSAVVLWECADHVAVVAGSGADWRDLAYGTEALGLIYTLRARQLASTGTASSPAAVQLGGGEPNERGVVEQGHAEDVERQALLSIWSEAGFLPEAAVPWIDAGLLPLHAKRWEGWAPTAAVAFALKALRPEDVRKWESVHAGQSAIAWVAAGFSLTSATEWIDAGVSLADAQRHRESGVRAARFLNQ